MRNNQPVTQREFDFPASEMLVSATDVKGRIQYCNPAFISVSGFAREELLGRRTT
jgi:aerotaxis receptor